MPATSTAVLDFDPSRSIASGIEILDNAIFSPYEGGGRKGEFRKAGILREDQSWCTTAIPWRSTTEPLLRQPSKTNDDLETLKGTYIYGGFMLKHFGHFLCETLARLWVLDHVDARIDGFVYFTKRQRGWPRKIIKPYVPIFNELGIDPETIHIPTNPLRIERLIVPPQGLGTKDMTAGSPEQREYLKSHFGNKIAANGPDKLYISRSALAGQPGMVLGEHVIEENLKREGYTIFHPQNHSLDEQIAHYKAAKKLVAMDGSALHLSAFFGTPEQEVAILNRRPDKMANAFVTQYASFGDIDAKIVDSVERFWYPHGQPIEMQRIYSQLNFQTLQESLVNSGFISKTHIWPAAEPSMLAAELDRFEKEIGAKLIEYRS